MNSDTNIEQLALATRISQKLIGPAEAIMGFHTLLIEEVGRSGPADALADLEKVGVAGARLVDAVRGLAGQSAKVARDDAARARLRHDLRSPINAILGYCEMVLEDFEADLPAASRADITAILTEARRLAVQIDVAFDAAQDAPDAKTHAQDDEIASRLERSLATADISRETLTGKILVIDDEAANREILTRLLKRRGHAVDAVGSAAQTYRALGQDRFDLILLDILMPDTNGIEVLIRLKTHASWREIPVVMVSGLKETGAIAKCISAGADDYLPKPIDPVLLNARVQACLEKVRWRAREIEYTNDIKFQKDRADTLLHAMLPAPVIERLNGGETRIADRFDGATIIFADIVDFTPLVARMDAGALVQELSNIFTAFDDLVTKYDIEKIKTIGDAYMAASGIPSPRNDHAQVAVDFARDALNVMSDPSITRQGLRIRVGIHSGPVIAGLIGRKRSVYDVWGETVNLASRLESTGEAGKIHISAATRYALSGLLRHEQAREHEVKGVGRITSYLIL